MAHPGSQGNIGDGILTAYAPSAGALVASSNPRGVYTYDWLDPARSAVTSYACAMTVGFLAQTLALAWSGNAPIPPYQFEQPNAYAYRMVKTRSAPRVAGGPPILYNNAPRELYQDCGGPGGYRKRDGSCPLTQIDLPTGSAALPSSISAAIMAGDEGQFGGNADADGTSPTLTAAIGGIIGGTAAGVAAGHQTSTFTTSPSTTTALCSHGADPQNTCAAIANSPGWCVCGDSPNSYPVQTSTNPQCGWATLPPTTSFDCPSATITPTPNIPPVASHPRTSTAPSASPTAGIVITLQQYSSTSGAEVATWFAFTYKPGDAKLGDPCNSNPSGTTPVPDGILVSEELSIYPKEMDIKAYNLNLKYETDLTIIGDLNIIKADESSEFLTNCNAVIHAVGEACDPQHEMIPRATCEW